MSSQLKINTKVLNGAITYTEKFVEWTKREILRSCHSSQRDFSPILTALMQPQTFWLLPIALSFLNGSSQNAVLNLALETNSFLSVNKLINLKELREILDFSEFIIKVQIWIAPRESKNSTVSLKVFQWLRFVPTNRATQQMITIWWNSRCLNACLKKTMMIF